MNIKKTHFPIYSSLELVETTPQKLAIIRHSEVPSFVLKKDGKLYYSKVPSNFNFISEIGGLHLCSLSRYECSRLSAASDEDGGCQKVRDYGKAKRIENYPWIIEGYEVFNASHDDCFVVIKCLHYEHTFKKKLTEEEIYNARFALIRYVWDDVVTVADLKKKLRKIEK